VEMGTHKELMIKGGYYHMLTTQQEEMNDALEIA
jgi:hypothetical protein